jgi:hypothetical protein
MRIPDKKKARIFLSENPGHKTGNNLLSHRIVAALPLAIEGLTAVVGMGTGVTPHLWSPEWFYDVQYRVIANTSCDLKSDQKIC